MGRGKGKAPIRDPSPVPEQGEVPEPETPEPKWTKKEEVTKVGKANLDVYNRYGPIRQNQWADRKRLLEDGTLQPQAKKSKTNAEPPVKKPPVKLRLPGPRKTEETSLAEVTQEGHLDEVTQETPQEQVTQETSKEQVTQETEDKLKDRKVLDRIDNVRKQLLSLRDLVAGEDLKVLNGAQVYLERAISQIQELTGALVPDDVDNLSSPGFLSPFRY